MYAVLRTHVRSLYTMFIKITCIKCNVCFVKNVTFSTCFFIVMLNVLHVDGFLYIGE